MEILIESLSLVAYQKECDGSEINAGRFSTLVECAEICKGKSTVFAFGAKVPRSSNNRCFADGCQCLCETSASTDGTCSQASHIGYRLYKYRYYKNSKYQFA